MFLPPANLAARLDSRVFDYSAARGLPHVTSAVPGSKPALSKRDFLKMAGAMLAANALPSHAATSGPMTFSAEPAPTVEAPAGNPNQVQVETLRLGEIPADFWSRPRELRLKRHRMRDEISVVYWRDGNLVAEGYWQACALLRDTTANVMTSMDPTVLDILRGISGFYEAWRWPHSPVITSGFRTLRTNNGLVSEGAAKNSMHLYGKAVDVFIPGVPAKDVSALGYQLQQGGVGFYPSKGFTHLDTGKLRLWRG